MRLFLSIWYFAELTKEFRVSSVSAEGILFSFFFFHSLGNSQEKENKRKILIVISHFCTQNSVPFSDLKISSFARRLERTLTHSICFGRECRQLVFAWWKSIDRSTEWVFVVCHNVTMALSVQRKVVKKRLRETENDKWQSNNNEENLLNANCRHDSWECVMLRGFLQIWTTHLKIHFTSFVLSRQFS